MRKIILIATAILLTFQTGVSAQSSKAQLGVIINSPTGISGKVWLDSRNALDGAIGWIIGDNSNFYFHADFLRHYFGKFTVEGGSLPLYWGMGIKFIFVDDYSTIAGNFIPKDDVVVGIRVPLGASYIYGGSQFDVFFEIAPFLNFTPDPMFSLDGAIGFRLFL